MAQVVLTSWAFQSLSIIREAFQLFVWDCVAPRSSYENRCAAAFAAEYKATKGETGKVTELHLQSFRPPEVCGGRALCSAGALL